MIEEHLGGIVASAVPVVIGAVVVGVVKSVVKSSVNGLILQMQEMFVPRRECVKQHQDDAKEREFIRKDVQNHEDRLNTRANGRAAPEGARS